MKCLEAGMNDLAGEERKSSKVSDRYRYSPCRYCIKYVTAAFKKVTTL